ncbi:MAG TPA: LuxR C-terminal-related transcriptional regulator, partial [Steroidobacteraceae bacterium]|nr:LuxR C-terminal-related transcriptional regulator [Steroidobacteraceae bacterium]
PAAASIIRAPLLRRLDEATRRKLVIIAAPTGSGKSTLLAQWHHKYASSRAIAWLSLDEQDSDPTRFFSYLIGAVRSVAEGFAAYIPSRRDDDAAALINSVAATFGEQLGRIDRELAIVIDDCQWLATPLLSRALDLLIRRAPPNVHWVVSGRCIPEVNVGALRVNDELGMIGAGDLSFDSALILALSRKLSNRPLSPADADYIRERTEGWVAGVKLALLAREESRANEDALHAFAGSHFEVANYLGGSVLQEQPQDVRTFLLGSCIVDRMTGELCNALLGITDSQCLLERLERAQLFIQPLDKHRHWFRYHTLFLDFLRSRLRRDEAAQLPTLHERASRWYAEHHFFEEALEHAFAAKNITWRNDLLARCAATWLQNGEIPEILKWTERLDLSEVLGEIAIARSYVSALILSRRFDEAASALSALRSQEANDASRATLEALETMYAVLTDSDDTRDFDARHLQSFGADIFLTGTLLTLKAYALLRRNQFDCSRRLALRARDTLRNVSAHSRGYAELVAALADRAQGDMKGASIRCEQTFAEVRTGRRNPAWVNAATPVAYVRYEENRLAEAEALCMEILPLLCVASTVESFTTAYITLARIRSASVRVSEANELLDYLHSVLEGSAHFRFLAQVCSEKILLALRTNDVARAFKLACEWELPRRFETGEFTHRRQYDEAWERAGTTYAHLLVASNEHRAALSILCTLRDSAREAGYVYRQVRIEAALACCHAGMDQHAESLAVLNGALALTRGYGFTRGVFDETPGLTQLVKSALAHHTLRHTLPFHYLRKFENLFVDATTVHQSRSPKITPSLPLEPLTDREIDILKLLARGLSNTEISARSQIALSTAKWHLKNVFAKLDVSTRTGALARARELKLVD